MDNIAKSTFSKFNQALVSVPQELTVAAANFNLDFSLMRVEAPKEFLGVGDALSTRRRGEAEEGQAHITARKLGALFETKAPSVPYLYQAYGKRASDISRRSKTESNNGLNPGIFASQAGPDGTSIWAAATSGPGAIAVHLLACMLARMWKSHEAISLWTELVERRKQEITESPMENIATIMASKQSFARQELAAWDSSARSWLQTADTDRRLQQTQLMLIINYVRLPVNSKGDVYESVLEAWRSGSIAMDRLVQGIPQQVQEGAILLAISSWHLYPNMEVLLENVKDIDQHDELMENALLTISAYGYVQDKEGVFWSLPLAKLRYYSTPVTVKRQLASRTSRVTIEDFWVIVLGALIRQWAPLSQDSNRLCKLIIRLSTLVNQPTVSIEWLKFLENAARRLQEPNDLDGLQSRKLLKLGKRWCAALLNNPQQDPPIFFGLHDFPTLLKFVTETEKKISILREIATTLSANPQDLLIQYKESLARPESRYNSGWSQYSFATALPIEPSPSFLSFTTNDSSTKTGQHDNDNIHARWIASEFFMRRPYDEQQSYCPYLDITPKDMWTNCDKSQCRCVYCACDEAKVICTLSCHGSKEDLLACKSSRSLLDRTEQSKGKCEQSQRGLPCDWCSLLARRKEIQQTGELCGIIQSDEIVQTDGWGFKLLGHYSDDSQPPFRVLLGDAREAAIFTVNSVNPRNQRPLKGFELLGMAPDIDDLELFLSSPLIDTQALKAYLRSWSDARGTVSEEQQCSLEAMTFATKLYESLPGATISVETAEKPLYEAWWVGSEGRSPKKR
ncbi:unnamed protein product [Periconia digitata]|uniref:Uncharacterized protein n=1 Tax=Periconia digitata TaxID=1303443 RepID=A0A9W4UMI5_9PLEO|nr:unnamed protein product [Periconia digitata]